LPFSLNSSSFIDEPDCSTSGLKDFIFASLAVFDPSFEVIIKMGFEVILEGSIVKNRQCAPKEAVKFEQVLCLLIQSVTIHS
jgi:hypothetical protein